MSLWMLSVIFLLVRILWFSIACLDLSLSVVTCEFDNLQDRCVFVLNYMYGLNTPASQKDPWDYLILLALGYQNRPWLIVGDFNVFLSSSDKYEGDLV